MNEYKFDLKDLSKAELFLSPNLDFILRKYKDNKLVESFCVYNGEIASYMPFILRFCYEEKVDLMENEFLKDLPKNNKCKINKPYIPNDEINKDYILTDFQRVLEKNEEPIVSKEGNLIICFHNLFNQSISFNKEDISNLIEGIIKVLDYDGIIKAQEKCIQIIQYYHECLDNKLFD